MFKIKVVGAGQLGSRHLQALKSVKFPLDIQVIDPSETSLKVAKERYEAVPSEIEHRIAFSTSLADRDTTDVAIVATNSDVRRQALDELFAASKTRFMILEKLLFNNRQDYSHAENLFSKTGVKAWVNCPMRVMPVYEQLRQELSPGPLLYRVTGSQFGLVTNAIHYIDHVVHLSNCTDFVLDTSDLDVKPIPSKRAGFLELNGTLVARFADGSRCEMTCYPTGSAPVMVEIFTENQRYLVRESEGKLWHSDIHSNWEWAERTANIPYQSQITTTVIESLLSSGDCGLTTYIGSAKTHLRLLDPLLELIRTHRPNSCGYPFT
ncbi:MULTISPECIES: oxidoreductase [Chromobacterium]|uniref:oxidoreductase n=1 Tax=Chromobacterium TaxID=535 RepID=UPI0011B28980|nr:MULTISPECIES: oxidoreductase [Chromobacterium]QOD82913.1 oxidoreductase [Chromobacterium haemolyticum]